MVGADLHLDGQRIIDQPLRFDKLSMAQTENAKRSGRWFTNIGAKQHVVCISSGANSRGVAQLNIDPDSVRSEMSLSLGINPMHDIMIHRL